MRQTLIIVNGKARAGKDTVVNFTMEFLNRVYGGKSTEAISSIQPVLDILDYLRIDVSQKTEEDRKLMSDLGNVLEDYSEYRSRKTLDSFSFISKFWFTFTREARVIERMKRIMREEYDGDTITLFVDNPRVSGVSSNSSDASVDFNYNYDYRIVNDGDMYDLEQKCIEFTRYLMNVTEVN